MNPGERKTFAPDVEVEDALADILSELAAHPGQTARCGAELSDGRTVIFRIEVLEVRTIQ